MPELATTQNGTTMYALENVTVEYPGKRQKVVAVKDAAFTIDEGSFVAIQGPTGGGKSTLLQLLGALDKPTRGSIVFDGAAMTGMSDHQLTKLRAADIGIVFQSFNLIPTLTAVENVETALVPLGVGKEERLERSVRALADVGLAERTDHLPSELSGGQQQRVAIARALVKQPRVLLADEPTGALDESTRDEILELLDRVRRERGLTLVVVTHDKHVAARAERRLRIAQGVVKELG